MKPISKVEEIQMKTMTAPNSSLGPGRLHPIPSAGKEQNQPNSLHPSVQNEETEGPVSPAPVNHTENSGFKHTNHRCHSARLQPTMQMYAEFLNTIRLNSFRGFERRYYGAREQHWTRCIAAAILTLTSVMVVVTLIIVCSYSSLLHRIVQISSYIYAVVAVLIVTGRSWNLVSTWSVRISIVFLGLAVLATTVFVFYHYSVSTSVGNIQQLTTSTCQPLYYIPMVYLSLQALLVITGLVCSFILHPIAKYYYLKSKLFASQWRCIRYQSIELLTPGLGLSDKRSYKELVQTYNRRLHQFNSGNFDELCELIDASRTKKGIKLSGSPNGSSDENSEMVEQRLRIARGVRIELEAGSLGSAILSNYFKVCSRRHSCWCQRRSQTLNPRPRNYLASTLVHAQLGRPIDSTNSALTPDFPTKSVEGLEENKNESRQESLRSASAISDPPSIVDIPLVLKESKKKNVKRVRYMGEINSLGQPSGFGYWKEDGNYWGERLVGYWANGLPCGPHKSRELGTGSGFMCIRIGWGHYTLNTDQLEFGIANVECCVSGRFYRNYPIVTLLSPPELEQCTPEKLQNAILTSSYGQVGNPQSNSGTNPSSQLNLPIDSLAAQPPEATFRPPVGMHEATHSPLTSTEYKSPYFDVNQQHSPRDAVTIDMAYTSPSAVCAENNDFAEAVEMRLHSARNLMSQVKKDLPSGGQNRENVANEESAITDGRWRPKAQNQPELQRPLHVAPSELSVRTNVTQIYPLEEDNVDHPRMSRSDLTPQVVHCPLHQADKDFSPSRPRPRRRPATIATTRKFARLPQSRSDDLPQHASPGTDGKHSDFSPNEASLKGHGQTVKGPNQGNPLVRFRKGALKVQGQVRYQGRNSVYAGAAFVQRLLGKRRLGKFKPLAKTRHDIAWCLSELCPHTPNFGIQPRSEINISVDYNNEIYISGWIMRKALIPPHDSFVDLSSSDSYLVEDSRDNSDLLASGEHIPDPVSALLSRDSDENLSPALKPRRKNSRDRSWLTCRSSTSNLPSARRLEGAVSVVEEHDKGSARALKGNAGVKTDATKRKSGRTQGDNSVMKMTMPAEETTTLKVKVVHRQLLTTSMEDQEEHELLTDNLGSGTESKRPRRLENHSSHSDHHDNSWAQNATGQPKPQSNPLGEKIPELSVEGWICRDVVGSPEALVYIHGFNNSQIESLQILGQMAAFGNYPNHIRLFVFTWPSGRGAFEFFKARAAAEDARTHKALETLLTALKDNG